MKTLNEIKWRIKVAEYRKNEAAVTSMLPSLGDRATLLDIGCADASGTLSYAEKAGVPAANVCGVDIDPDYIEMATTKIKVFAADMEHDPLPFDEGVFDIVICNQILEHIKNLRHLLAQVDKVTKPGGFLLISVPNLAALHNRLGLLFGGQPRCAKVLSAHIRGFSPSALKQFLTTNGRFKVVSAGGSGFYPFPAAVSGIISRLMPTFAVYYMVLLQKTGDGDWDSWNRVPEV